MGKIDLKKEQQASMERPRCKYTLIAKVFFLGMDILTGRKTTLSKVKLLEILACIPYRAWELRQYLRMSMSYRKTEKVREAKRITAWGRAAQDNEYGHLIVINEKMKADNVRDAWYLLPPLTFLMVLQYWIASRLLAFISIRRAFLFNAEFEDHAEHVYANFVAEHPEWEEQSVDNKIVSEEYGDFDNWADVFRRIGLDERDHRNSSFAFANQPENIVRYDGDEDVAKHE